MENNIQDAYNNLMELGNITEEDSSKLTEENVNDILTTMENVLENNENLKVIAQLPSNNGILETSDNKLEGEDVLARVKINPVTNESVMVGLVEDDEDISEESSFFEDILNNDDSTEIEDIKFRQDVVGKAIENKFNCDFDEHDVIKFVNLLNDYKNDNTIDAYNRLPDKIKKSIDAMAAKEGIPYNTLTTLKRSVTRELLDDFIMDVTIENYQVELHEELDNMFSGMRSEIRDMSIDMTRQQIVKLTEMEPEMREKNPELADRLLKIVDGMENSFTYEKLYEAIKERRLGKIRKIDLEKPEKIYKNFNYKYSRSIYNIYDICMLPDILKKFLPDDIEMENIHKFLIYFCKYCENFNPEILEEHSFMYYTILNMVLLNINSRSEEEDTFSKELIENIVKVISII